LPGKDVARQPGGATSLLCFEQKSTALNGIEYGKAGGLKMTNVLKKFHPRVFAALILAGILAFVLAGAAHAAPKAAPVKIAYLDRGEAFRRHPGAQAAFDAVMAERNRLQAEYNEKAKDLSPEERQRLSNELSAQAAAKEAELLKPIQADIDAAIDAAMAEGGYAFVLERNAVIRGGTDITAEVVKKFGS
jgi:outer membrane protein